MKKVVRLLADYVISKGLVEEEDRAIYEYGFTITIEVGLFILFCLFTTLYLHMFIEGILFLVIFAPLRSYAGGLHLEKYHSCFILSCFTFLGILFAVRYIRTPIWFSFVSLLILATIIYLLYPVENINRKVDKDEDRYFKKKLKLFLFMDTIMAVACIILNNSRALFLIAVTYLVVAITMLMGKHCNNTR
jgi:accessory gene regulator B